MQIDEIAVEIFQNFWLIVGLGVAIHFLKQEMMKQFIAVLVVGGMLTSLAIETTEFVKNPEYQASIANFFYNALWFSLGTIAVVYLIHRYKPAAWKVILGITILILIFTPAQTIVAGNFGWNSLIHTLAIWFGATWVIATILWQIRLDYSVTPALGKVLRVWLITNLVFSLTIWIIDYSGWL